MRRDVRLLGDLLGEVLSETNGQDLLEDVERLRRLTIAARAGTAGSTDHDQIAALVASWPLQRAELVARAFTVYFHLANLAEEVDRIRTLRESDAARRRVRVPRPASRRVRVPRPASRRVRVPRAASRRVRVPRAASRRVRVPRAASRWVRVPRAASRWVRVPRPARRRASRSPRPSPRSAVSTARSGCVS